MLVRHAEKPGSGPAQGVDIDGNPDPHSLTVRGWTRAGALVELFAPAHGPTRPGLARPTAVFAAGGQTGKGRRPRETINPLAARLNIPVDTAYTEGQEPALARHVAARPGPTLISWEHGGIPALLAAFPHLQPTPPTSWPDDRFDLIWTLTPTTTGWTFTQLPQLLLDGDSAQPAT
jgi:hypothetical protein